MAAPTECYRCGTYVTHGMVTCSDCTKVLVDRIQRLEDELRAVKADPFKLIREMGAHDTTGIYTEETET